MWGGRERGGFGWGGDRGRWMMRREMMGHRGWGMGSGWGMGGWGMGGMGPGWGYGPGYGGYGYGPGFGLGLGRGCSPFFLLSLLPVLAVLVGAVRRRSRG